MAEHKDEPVRNVKTAYGCVQNEGLGAGVTPAQPWPLCAIE